METEAATPLLIHARRLFDDVVADPSRFRAAADELVGRARRAEDAEALVHALRAQAGARRAELADGPAKRLLDEAAHIARRHDLTAALADVLMSRAAVNQELGRLDAARRDLDAAGRHVAPDRAADLGLQRGALEQNIGRLAAAAATYRDVLARHDPPDRVAAIVGNNLALIEAQQGRHPVALRRLDEAEACARRVGPALVAMVTESRAWVVVRSGRLAEGLRIFDRAARLHAEAGLPLGEHFVEYADALIDLRLIPEATRAARDAVTAFTDSDVPLMRAEAQLRMAQLAMLADDLDGARAAAAVAEDSFARQGRGTWRARASLVRCEARLRAGTADATDLRDARRVARLLERSGMRASAVTAHLVAGRIAAHTGRRRKAVATLERAAELARRSPILVRLNGALAGALAARLRRDPADVLAHARRGLADLAGHRAALPSMELRALASGHGVELGQLGLEVAVHDGRAHRVLDWLERTRAAALVTVEAPADGTVRDDLAELRSVHAGQSELAGAADRQVRPAPELARQAEIEARIRRVTWRGEPPAGAVPAGARPPLRPHLGGRVLVEYGVLNGSLLAVVVEPRRSRLVALGPLGAVLEQVRSLHFALRRLADDRPAASLAAARLSADLRVERLTALLLRPLAVDPDAELVIVPAGPLQGIPWSALAAAPVSLAPSARSWVRTRLRAQDHRPAGARLVVQGPGLPGAADEVDRLRHRYPDATVLVPPESTAAAVLGCLDGADLVHLACHGWLRSDNPLFSSLVLADGPVTVQELQAAPTPPHRLVLAACQSAADVAYPADEVLGFVSALLARGTAGIVGSVAAVPDVSSADLMDALHRHLAGGTTLARALHAARRDLARDTPAAYVNWCTFNAYGAA
jgi:tetratricopeptide (TPR) repeat protein